MFAARRGAGALAFLLVLALPASAGAQLGRATSSVPGSLAITVWADGLPADSLPGPSVAAGHDTAWDYEVTNAGASELWALYVWHEGVGAAACPDRSLAPGEMVRCTASAASQPGPQAAAVSAWAWDDAGAQASGEATAFYTGSSAGVVPSLEIEATVGGRDADTPPGPALIIGRRAIFRYRVDNTGDAALFGVWVRDSVLGTITCPRRSLGPGEGMTCAAARVAVAGPYSAVAEARGSDASGAEVADEDAVHFFGAVSGPAVDLEALVAGFDGDLPPGPRVAVPGDVVPFTYEVTNRGTVALRAIAVTDGVLGRVACPARTLAPGTTMVCRASVVARLGEFGATARVTARSGAVVVGDSDPVYYHVRPELRIHHLDLEVMVNQLAADDPTGPRLPVGGLARFAYVITYTGNNVVYNVTIQDPFVPEALITCDGDRILEAGETLRCAAAVPVVAGQYSSAVTAVSWDANGRRVSAEDRVHYFGVA